MPKERTTFADDPYQTRIHEKKFRLQSKMQVMSDEINTCMRAVLKLPVVRSINESEPSGNVMFALRNLVRVSRLFFAFFVYRLHIADVFLGTRKKCGEAIDLRCERRGGRRFAGRFQGEVDG